MITVEDGNTYSKAGYITHSADSSVRVDVAELSDLRERVHGNNVVVTGSDHERGMSKGKPYEYHDRLTDVWVKAGQYLAGDCFALQHPCEVAGLLSATLLTSRSRRQF